MSSFHPDSFETLHERLSATARASPGNAPFGSAAWEPDFAGLDAVASRIAAAVHSHGAGLGDVVAVFMEHDSSQIAVVLGLLKAGCLITIMPVEAPMESQRQILAHATAVLAIVDQAWEAHAARLIENRGAVLSIQTLVAFEGGEPLPPVSPDSAAFLIFTSGSTGVPKAVIQTHRNILHTVDYYIRTFHLGPDDRICLFGALSGGQGIMTTFAALLSGARLYPYALRRRGVIGLASWMQQHEITVCIAASSVFRQFARVADKVALPHLRLVRLGAEQATAEDLAICRSLVSPTCQFAHVFSSSETSCIALYHAPLGAVPLDEPIPVGCPLPEKRILLWDADGREVPAGSVGEIVVRSRFLSPGYWRDEAGTRAVFSDIAGSAERLYRTGDLGRWRSDGMLEHLGRKDRRHKILGNKVDLQAIESALMALPEVVEAAVDVAPETHQPEAWVVVREGADWDECGVRQKLADILPLFATVRDFHRVLTLPRTANGKIDWRTLRVGRKQIACTKAAPGPRTTTEERVAAAWRKVFDQPEIGIYDDFFESRGDSLKAADLIVLLSESSGIPLDPGALLHHPTIAQFAEGLETGRIGGGKQRGWQLPRAELLALGDAGEARPVLFVPGGYGGENELMTFARLARRLPPGRRAWGARLNLHGRRVLPWVFPSRLVRQLILAYCKSEGTRPPMVVGECRAASLAWMTAEHFRRRLGTAPPLVLLDPWQPRTRPPRTVEHPPAVVRYYRALDRLPLTAYPGEVHLVCAEETRRGEVCRDWWSERMGRPCHLHNTPGDHTTYLREHCDALAMLLGRIMLRDRAK